MPLTQSAKLTQLHTQKLCSGTIMPSNSSTKPFVMPTLESTKASTPDSSKNYAKSTNKNKNNTPALLSTVIAPQNDK
eukprot:9222683-Ditylum_brightwellii.AAC.1